MFDIVNNKRNSVDVDKFDYISRDTKMMDIAYGVFDFRILLKGARVMHN
jgi:HD superfamily phosphohydrolase